MKKTINIIAKSLFLLIMLPLGLLLLFWIRNQFYLEGTEEENIAYLSLNKQDLRPQLLGTAPDTALFDSAFYNNCVFLLGESHGFADAQLIDQYMLLHLNRKTGVRYYLAEMDSIRAKSLNEFLGKETKDTLLLKQVVSDIRLRIPQQSSNELYKKWLAIYDYNKALPKAAKIIVIGIDKDFKDVSREVSRDSMMLLNFKRAVEAQGLENEKFYGFFGYTHVLQSGYGERNIHPFAAKIKRSNLPFATKTQSIVCLTLESEMAIPRNEQFPTPADEKTSLGNADGPFMLVKGIKDLKEVTGKNTITLFDLNNTNSPYRHNQKLAGIKVNLPGGDIRPNNDRQKTTDFFQHAILIRNSKALTRLD